ncbi:hypothetical protein GCM10009648_42440 [Tsukamurella spumae]
MLGETGAREPYDGAERRTSRMFSSIASLFARACILEGEVPMLTVLAAAPLVRHGGASCATMQWRRARRRAPGEAGT